MISLVTPASGVDKYFLWNNFILGPLADDGTVDEEDLVFSSPLEGLVQGSGIWHEKAVIHSSINGSIRFIHGSLALISTPTALLPDRQKLQTVSNISPTQTTWLEANFGLGVSGRVGHYSSGTSVYAGCCVGSGTSFTVYAINGQSTQPTKVASCFIHRIKLFQKKDSATWNMTRTSQQYSASFGITTAIPILQFSSAGQFEALCESAPVKYPESAPTVVAVRWNQLKPILPFSPANTSAEILSFAADLGPETNPIEAKHFGELAMEASSKMNANDVNMFEFLRDLRHPKDMLIKLRNFKKLKTMANNYLSVNYGILPTISDVKDIVAAFTKRKPFLDRNGFTVVTAMFDDSATAGTKTYKLEQRLKLAIADEDDGIQLLVERLDSMGTWPTCENIWQLIPYSFIVDWLVDVGGLLERVDTRLRLATLNIRYVTTSLKQTTTMEISSGLGLPYTGTIEWVQYQRWVSDQCPVPPWLLKVPFSDFDHWLESTALLIQRRKR